LFSRTTATFNGTLIVTNTMAQPITKAIQVVLENLTPGVTLANATGTTGGNPYISVPNSGGLAAGQSVSVSAQFKDPSNASITFTPIAY
jgi:hypothetical protein